MTRSLHIPPTARKNAVYGALTELETENAKLKRMYAELALENAAIKDVLNRKL
jgi:hypothetical protein